MKYGYCISISVCAVLFSRIRGLASMAGPQPNGYFDRNGIPEDLAEGRSCGFVEEEPRQGVFRDLGGGWSCVHHVCRG